MPDPLRGYGRAEPLRDNLMQSNQLWQLTIGGQDCRRGAAALRFHNPHGRDRLLHAARRSQRGPPNGSFFAGASSCRSPGR